MSMIRTIDLFCGAGGSSWGARNAGGEIIAGFDMWELAGKVFKSNFPQADFFHGKLESMDLEKIKPNLGDIDMIIASPECTNHSPAKGAGPRCEISKETAFQVVRFARVLSPRWIIVENVVSMRNWKRYSEFLTGLQKLGYHIREQILNSKNFGVPQSRRRLFITCDRKTEPPVITSHSRKAKGALSVVSWDAEYKFSPLRTKRRAKATLVRAQRAIHELGDNQAFLLVYYGSDKAGGWQRLDVPLRTITTLDRFALVKPSTKGHEMRMLQPPELKKAMGMPISFTLNHGTRRDRVHLIGNAVCPPVMRRVVRIVTTGR